MSMPKCSPHGHDSNHNAMVVPCLNRCGQVLECTRMDDHLANSCPLTMIDCEFKHVGCDVRLPRRDMPLHLGLAVVIHLSKQLACYEERVKMLEADNERLAEKCNRMESGLVKLENKLDKLSINLGILPKDSRQLKAALNTTSLGFGSQDNGTANYVYKIEPAKSFVCPTKLKEFSTSECLTMVNFEQHKKNNDHWVSPPFYTHAQGYKMCLRVAANGKGCGKETHISVEVCLMKGEFDDQLEWPFKGNIAIQLLNQQQSDDGHYTRTVYQALALRYSKKEEEQNIINVWGYNKYKPHRELRPKYLKSDCLSFRIFLLDSSEPLLPQELVTDV